MKPIFLGVVLRLDKHERLGLWTRLNGDIFQPYKETIEGVWRFVSHGKNTSNLSREDLPHLWIVGSVHGNEAVGAVVLERLMMLAHRGELIEHGELTLVLGNPAAFLADQRYIDRDLNRAFGLTSASPSNIEAVRQAKLHNLLQSRPPQFVLDLHSVSSGDHGIIVYPKESSIWAERLGCLGTHFCYSKEHMAGETLIDAAHRYGAGAMVVECGHHHSPNTPIVALAHIQKLLHYFKITSKVLIDEPLPEVSIITRYRSTKMIRPYRGFKFLFPVETGSAIEAHVPYAIDARGEHVEDQPAWLMMPSLEVKPHDQDAGWLCSLEQITQV